MRAKERDVRIWAIIPAAGKGRRMGRPKQTLPFADSTLAGTVVRTLLAAGAERIMVVTRTPLVGALALPADPRIAICLNDDGTAEMIDSIRIGLAALVGSAERAATPRRSDSNSASFGTPLPNDGVVVVPADMPELSVATCSACFRAFAEDPQRIVMAAHSSYRGHPIIFPFSLRRDVDGLAGGLNQLPRMHPQRVCVVEVDDPGITRDVDSATDYQNLKKP